MHAAAWGKGLLLTALALLAPARALFVASIFLVALDFVTGSWAAHKRGEKITSAGFRRTVAKALVYNLAILAAFVAEKWLLSDALPASKLAAGVIALTELKSTNENLTTISGVNLLGAAIERLGSKSMKE